MIAQDVRGSNKTTCPDILNVIGEEGLSVFEEGLLAFDSVVIFRRKNFSLCFSMYVAPQDLVVIYSALRKNDDNGVQEIFTILRAANESYDITTCEPPDPYSNYFFQINDVVGLCVEDTPTTRNMAQQLGISDYIYFGSNEDAVQLLTLEQVHALMPNVKKWYGESEKIPDMKALRIR